MSIVLDTNALVWAFVGDPALGGRTIRSIDEAVSAGVAHVSAISFWELALKIRKGKFALGKTIVDWRSDVLRLGVREVAVDGTIGIRANHLQGLHEDPADRLIVATALELGASLITSDAKLLAWKGPLACIDARV
ncbi:MAG: type II toxin-antitoxin system VapC family toxin [Reyranella sp.]|jgi:PIN domain nuclease of toxin-antitoxin system|nr:type II toxin-antitoxin system VapC family toxin [Reyranella sp.]